MKMTAYALFIGIIKKKVLISDLFIYLRTQFTKNRYYSYFIMFDFLVLLYTIFTLYVTDKVLKVMSYFLLPKTILIQYT